jgi:glyceraldehyde 3-phosphate dehydrogenase
MRVAINGFGRIGRCVYRAAADDPDIDIVAINDLSSPEDLHYLLQYDSVHGTYGGVDLDDGVLVRNGDRTPLYQRESPADLPWEQYDVDVALECTGVFRTKDDAARHLDAGAAKTLISAPPKSGGVPQLVYGVNHATYDGERVVSNASCTTNSLAPLAQVLHERFGIRSGLLTTVHAYTGSQKLIDGPSSKRRRGRAAAENIVPTTTGAANAVTTVIPELEGRLDGMAMRVPTPNGSVSDLVVDLAEDVPVDQINAAFREAAANDLDGVLRYTDDELVSRDILGDPHSCIVDGQSTMRTGNGMVKVLGWYDNEAGFAHRMLDTATHIHTR